MGDLTKLSQNLLQKPKTFNIVFISSAVSELSGIILWGIHRLLIDNYVMKSKNLSCYVLSVENRVIFHVFFIT